MSKKSFIIFMLMTVSVGVLRAQNLQLHFDPRHALHGNKMSDKNYFTATFEMFKPDKWGSTFMFIDLDLNQRKANIGTMYLEIARDIKLWKPPVAAHVEFNGGVGKADNFGFSIVNAYMVGPSFSTSVKGWNLGTYLVYKYQAFDRTSNDVQWTVTWGGSLFHDKLTIDGFIDFWTQDKFTTHGTERGGKKIIMITEPQFWYNVTPHLSVGTEIEISNNFLTPANGEQLNKVYINPTIAAKWNF